MRNSVPSFGIFPGALSSWPHCPGQVLRCSWNHPGSGLSVPALTGKRSGCTARSEVCQWVLPLPFIRARKALPSHFAKFFWRRDLEFYLSSPAERTPDRSSFLVSDRLPGCCFPVRNLLLNGIALYCFTFPLPGFGVKVMIASQNG